MFSRKPSIPSLKFSQNKLFKGTSQQSASAPPPSFTPSEDEQAMSHQLHLHTQTQAPKQALFSPSGTSCVPSPLSSSSSGNDISSVPKRDMDGPHLVQTFHCIRVYRDSKQEFKLVRTDGQIINAPETAEYDESYFPALATRPPTAPSPTTPQQSVPGVPLARSRMPSNGSFDSRVSKASLSNQQQLSYGSVFLGQTQVTGVGGGLRPPGMSRSQSVRPARSGGILKKSSNANMAPTVKTSTDSAGSGSGDSLRLRASSDAMKPNSFSMTRSVSERKPVPQYKPPTKEDLIVAYRLRLVRAPPNVYWAKSSKSPKSPSLLSPFSPSPSMNETGASPIQEVVVLPIPLSKLKSISLRATAPVFVETQHINAMNDTSARLGYASSTPMTPSETSEAALSPWNRATVSTAVSRSYLPPTVTLNLPMSPLPEIDQASHWRAGLDAANTRNQPQKLPLVIAYLIGRLDRDSDYVNTGGADEAGDAGEEDSNEEYPQGGFDDDMSFMDEPLPASAQSKLPADVIRRRRMGLERLAREIAKSLKSTTDSWTTTTTTTQMPSTTPASMNVTLLAHRLFTLIRDARFIGVHQRFWAALAPWVVGKWEFLGLSKDTRWSEEAPEVLVLAVMVAARRARWYEVFLTASLTWNHGDRMAAVGMLKRVDRILPRKDGTNLSASSSGRSFAAAVVVGGAGAAPGSQQRLLMTEWEVKSYQRKEVIDFERKVAEEKWVRQMKYIEKMRLGITHHEEDEILPPPMLMKRRPSTKTVSTVAETLASVSTIEEMEYDAAGTRMKEYQHYSPNDSGYMIDCGVSGTSDCSCYECCPEKDNSGSGAASKEITPASSNVPTVVEFSDDMFDEEVSSVFVLPYGENGFEASQSDTVSVFTMRTINQILSSYYSNPVDRSDQVSVWSSDTTQTGAVFRSRGHCRRNFSNVNLAEEPDVAVLAAMDSLHQWKMEVESGKVKLASVYSPVVEELAGKTNVMSGAGAFAGMHDDDGEAAVGGGSKGHGKKLMRAFMSSFNTERGGALTTGGSSTGGSVGTKSQDLNGVLSWDVVGDGSNGSGSRVSTSSVGMFEGESLVASVVVVRNAHGHVVNTVVYPKRLTSPTKINPFTR